ncbi:MAG: AEC family transporter [Caldilineaceae bacterium]|nr:AEC family transporter [Caldilineaceae bacterium]MCB9139122.1 AEC family transporter [Caldilineaceae bacterium]
MGQLLSIFFNTLAPVFSLVLIGYIAGPRLGIEARSPSRMAYYILVPPFIYNIFKDAEIEPGLALRMSLYILAVTLVTVAAALVIALAIRRTAPPMTAAYVLLAVFGNVGNFGLPIIEFGMGKEALVAASLYFIVILSLGFIVGVMAANWYRGGGLQAVWKAFTTPAILALPPALIVNYFDLTTPLFIDRAVTLMSGALIPVMLITLGVQLAAMGRVRISLDGALAGSVRLVIGPLAAIALAAPFGITGVERGAGILQAGMPAAVLTTLIAMEHDLLPDFVTTTVLFATLFSSVTLTLVLALI